MMIISRLIADVSVMNFTMFIHALSDTAIKLVHTYRDKLAI